MVNKRPKERETSNADWLQMLKKKYVTSVTITLEIKMKGIPITQEHVAECGNPCLQSQNLSGRSGMIIVQG